MDKSQGVVSAVPVNGSADAEPLLNRGWIDAMDRGESQMEAPELSSLAESSVKVEQSLYSN